ncbi:hypothetical protein AYI69_g4219 [Smittium culicis]|uniref:Uncharacterized protein n=1 Tax=Smittium culicis TaxID=133412 RepID=A0A1R1YFI7_9FUNG|nr:hypothetical protein AYI69_g4219 [Smittium culicis]
MYLNKSSNELYRLKTGILVIPVEKILTQLYISLVCDSEGNYKRFGGQRFQRRNRFVWYMLGHSLCTSPAIDSDMDLSRLAAYCRRARSISPTFGYAAGRPAE